MVHRVPPIPSDPGLPGARGLIGEEGHRTLAAFLGERGWTLRESRPVQATYRPGRSMTVRYRAVAEAAGADRSFRLCVETRVRPRRAGPVPDRFAEHHGLSDPVSRRGDLLVWAFPYDPSLPGVTEAAWGPAVGDGLARGGRRPAAVSIEPLRYRPRRRAVFRYRAVHLDRRGREWETGFGKVLPGDKVERLRAAASALHVASRRVPLALPRAEVGRDVMVYAPMPGRSLRDLLMRGGSLPSPARVAALPRSLAAALGDGGSELRPKRRRPVQLAELGAEVVTRLVPSSADAARRVLDATAEGSAWDEARPAIVHGDLYEAQVFVDERYSLGLIDLDDVGLGDPALDAANFCAHLLALALAVPAAAGRLVAYRRLVRPAFARSLDISPTALAWREALCMLLLAAGPFRVLAPAWPTEVGRRAALAVRLLEDP